MPTNSELHSYPPAFAAFLRTTNIALDDSDVAGLDLLELEAKYPSFRQYHYSEKVADDGGVIVDPTTVQVLTSSPTESPKESVTSSPTESSDKTVTSSPTESPDNSVTETLNLCVSNDKGDFFVSTSYTEDTQVNFTYEIVTDGVSDLSTEVLPVLEKSILDSILPVMFGDACSGRRLEKSNLRQSTSRRLNLLGASASPPDTVSARECTDAGIDCSVIDGKMTFFNDNSADLSSVEGLTCDAMNSKAVLGSHPSILSLRCVGADSNIIIGGGPSVNEGIEDPGSNPASQNIGRNFYILSSLAGVVILLGAYAYRRKNSKNRQQMDDRAVLHLDDSDIQNVSTSSDLYTPTSFQGPDEYEKSKKPAFDLRSISPPVFKGEVIEESVEEDEDDESANPMLEEVSLFDDNANSYDISNMS